MEPGVLILQLSLAAALVFLLNRIRTNIVQGAINSQFGMIEREEQPSLYHYMLARLAFGSLLLSAILGATFVGAENDAALMGLFAVCLFSIAALAFIGVLMGITSGIILRRWEAIDRRTQPIVFLITFVLYLGCALGFTAAGFMVLYEVSR